MNRRLQAHSCKFGDTKFEETAKTEKISRRHKTATLLARRLPIKDSPTAFGSRHVWPPPIHPSAAGADTCELTRSGICHCPPTPQVHMMPARLTQAGCSVCKFGRPVPPGWLCSLSLSLFFVFVLCLAFVLVFSSAGKAPRRCVTPPDRSPPAAAGSAAAPPAFSCMTTTPPCAVAAARDAGADAGAGIHPIPNPCTTRVPLRRDITGPPPR